MDELSVAVQALFRAAEMQRRRLADEQPASMSEIRAMARISENPGISITLLAADLDLKASTTSTLVEALVESGFVLRSTVPTNRRQLQLELTEQGRAVIDGVYDGFASVVTAAVDDLAPDEISALTALLRQLAIRMTPSPPEAG
jgi:DNA-binding MarR family transcriptional regulator